MYIRCKSCGQLLYVPDDSNDKSVCCPACKTESFYTSESTPSSEECENSSTSATDQQEFEDAPAVEPLPEYAPRESYHQPRNLILQRFSSWDALLTAYRIYSRNFGVYFLFAIISAIPGLIVYCLQNVLVPEFVEMQNSLSELKSMEDVFKASQDLNLSFTTILTVFGINLLSSILSLFLIIGRVRLFNAFGRTQKASIWLTFSGFDSPGRTLLFFIILYILTLAAGVAGTFFIILMAMLHLVEIGIFILMCFIIVFLSYLFFALPLIADSNLPAVNAFQLSYIIARRNLSPLIGTISLLFLMMMFVSWFTMALFGNILPTVYIGLISQALFEPLMIGVMSVAYLKATGQFRAYK